jgi:hypothetical protein
VKSGDLVRHPKGMVNVCEKQYSSGIVLDVIHPSNPPGQEQCLVLWCGFGLIGPMQYLSDQLEVISEAR